MRTWQAIPSTSAYVRRIARYLSVSLAMLAVLAVAEALILWWLGIPISPGANLPVRTISRFALRANGGGAAIFRYVGNVSDQCWTEAMLFPPQQWSNFGALDCAGRAPIEIA